MTGPAMRDIQGLEGLKVLASADELPSGARRSCQELAEKFDAPLRIGIFGLNGSGKKRILNALLGARVAMESASLPTLEVLPGREEKTTAMLADGATLEMPGFPDEELLALEPMFLSVTSPACDDLRQSFLLTVCDDTFEDLSAGLSWAATRIDLAIWCTEHWTRLERRVYAQVPDHLKDHAVFCLASPFAADVAVPEGFDTAFRMDPSDDAASSCAALADHVRGVIEEARRADILAAEALLHRYGGFLAEEPAPAPAAPDTRPAPREVDEAAVAQLTFLFRHLRGSAESLRAAGGSCARTLSALEHAFEELADHAMDLHAFGETWPEVDEAISEARDLCVLLKMEGGDDQAEDAARMLLQLRWDIEAKLAA
ncbi:MAG: hypothetical protein AAFM92_10240 [Pseudomonadota bacterium]